MFVCVYVCMYVCMYVCIYVCMYVCIYIYIYIFLHLYPDHPIWQTVATCGKKISSGKILPDERIIWQNLSSGKSLSDIWQNPFAGYLAKANSSGKVLPDGILHDLWSKPLVIKTHMHA